MQTSNPAVISADGDTPQERYITGATGAYTVTGVGPFTVTDPDGAVVGTVASYRQGVRLVLQKTDPLPRPR